MNDQTRQQDSEQLQRTAAELIEESRRLREQAAKLFEQAQKIRQAVERHERREDK